MKSEHLLSMPKEPSVTKLAAFSLTEIILASAVFGLLVTALVGSYLYGQEATALAGNRARAVLLAEEALEAMRNIRDPAFVNLTDGTYGLVTTGNQWAVSGAQDTTDIFTRNINIVSVDSKRKNITANVTWQQNVQRTGTVSLVTRLTNWIALGIGNWASPLKGASLDVTGNDNLNKIQIQGNYAYLTFANGNPDFLVIDFSNLANPVVVGSLVLAGTPTNIVVSGNFAYVSSSDNGQELQIVNIATPASPTLAGTYNAPGNADALGVFASGSTVYLVRASSADNELLIINAAIPSAPNLVGSRDLGNQGNEIVVAGNFAYVASSDNNQELQVLNITNPASPTLAGSLNLSGNTDAITIALTGTIVLLGQANTLQSVDVTLPGSPVLLGSLSLSGVVNDIASDFGNTGTYAFLATGNDTKELQVINIATPSAPVLLGSVDVATNSDLLGIAYDATLDRAFGSSASNSEEFIIFAPQ